MEETDVYLITCINTGGSVSTKFALRIIDWLPIVFYSPIDFFFDMDSDKTR